MSKHSRKMTKMSQNKRKKKGKKIVILLGVLVVILLGIGCGFIENKLNKINYVELNTDELEVSDSVKGYRNIALLAVDSRNLNSNDGSRSDGIIILSINEKSKDIKLLSVYRDTYLQVEGHGLTKITHAYAYGGPTLAIKTLNSNLDLNISEFVAVNFEAVANAIDLIGGIEIEIKQEELEQMNKYIEETAKITGMTANKIPSAGT